MENKKLQIEKITDKIEIEEVEVQADPCKNDPYNGIYDCLRDCSSGTSPKGTPAY